MCEHWYSVMRYIEGSFEVSIENDNVYVHVDFQVVQAFPSFENLKDRQLHFSTEHGA
jgi:hypothetical protein